MSMGNFPESLSQGILVGMILVGRLGVALGWARGQDVMTGQASCQSGSEGEIGWHYLSNATCLMRPRLFHALYIVSRVTII